MGVTYSFILGQRNKKRPLEEDANEDKMRVPVKKKLRTSDYIYSQLFEKGESADMVIEALGKEWHLHKVYLSQSPYFAAMFSKDWKESKKSRIHMNIPDKLITTTSLDCALGSLYRDEVSIEPATVVNLVAAASLLTLDSLIVQCGEVMADNLSAKTVIPFLKASETYGLQDVRTACFNWLLQHILELSSAPTFLKNISCDLMQELICSPDLFVVQGEVDIYSMLKLWIFSKMKRKCESNFKQEFEEFFTALKTQKGCFLESSAGEIFQPVFAQLRLQHIATSIKSVKALMSENVIPQTILTTLMSQMWTTQLEMESQFEQDAESCLNLSQEEFDRNCLRCGRVLPQDTPFCWRWSGFNFGVDVLLSYRHKFLSIKRNCSSQPTPYSINMKPQRAILYRLRVASFNEDRKLVWSKDTGFKRCVLDKDESIRVMQIAPSVPFPITVIFNCIACPPQEPLEWNFSQGSLDDSDVDNV